MKVPIIGDWGGKCGKAQKKVMKSISRSDVDNVISVGDTIYISKKNEQNSQNCNFEDCKKIIQNIITENMKCTKLLQGKYWIMAFGNHDEEYPKVTANSKLSCLINDLIEDIYPKLFIMNPKTLENRYFLEPKFRETHNVLFIVLNTSEYEINFKKSSPSCTITKFLENNQFNEYSIDRRYFLKGITIADYQKTEHILIKLYLKKERISYEEHKHLQYFFNNNKQYNWLRRQLNNTKYIGNSKIYIVGHHPIVCVGHQPIKKMEKKFNKIKGNLMMRYIYDSLIKHYPSVKGYFGGHIHSLQRIVDTNNNDFTFILSGAGGGNEEENLDKLNEDNLELIGEDGFEILEFSNKNGYFNMNFDGSDIDFELIEV